MLDHGIYLAPAQFEAMFVSMVHTQEQLDETIDVAADFFYSDKIKEKRIESLL